MNKLKLSRTVFWLVVLLIILGFLSLFFNPGFTIQLIGVYSLYYFTPILSLLLIIDFIFNSQLEKKYLFRAIFIIIFLVIISLVLRYLVSSSFHIFP